VSSLVRQAYRGRPSTLRTRNCGRRRRHPSPLDGCGVAGGGRKPLSETDTTLLTDLESLVEPTTRGDPESPLRWTCKSTAKLAEELRPLGHRVSQRTIYTLLGHLGYSLQSNRKTGEGGTHPDRDAQVQADRVLEGRQALRGGTLRQDRAQDVQQVVVAEARSWVK